MSAPGDEGEPEAGLAKLPPGRHGLPRDFVIQHQRQRILAAVPLAVSTSGYGELTVEAIISRAGISRRTFYEHFHNKQEAFLATYDAAAIQMLTNVRNAYQGIEDYVERLRAGLKAIIDFFVADPPLARMCMVEVLAAGHQAIERRRAAQRVFATIIEENVRETLPDCKVPSNITEMVVGGIYEVLYAYILRGAIDDLPGLLSDLVYFALLPVHGPDKGKR